MTLTAQMALCNFFLILTPVFGYIFLDKYLRDFTILFYDIQNEMKPCYFSSLVLYYNFSSVWLNRFWYFYTLRRLCFKIGLRGFVKDHFKRWLSTIFWHFVCFTVINEIPLNFGTSKTFWDLSCTSNYGCSQQH